MSRSSHYSAPLALFLCGSLPLGCDSTETEESEGASVTANAGGAGSPTPCIHIGQVRGAIGTLEGTPPTENTFTVCGSSCAYAETENDGTFNQSIDHCYVPGAGYPEPVFVFHGESTYADFNLDFVPDGAMSVDDHRFKETLYAVEKSGFEAKVEDGVPIEVDSPEGLQLSAPGDAIEVAFLHDSISVTRVEPRYFPLGTQAPPLLDAWYIGPDNSYIEGPV